MAVQSTTLKRGTTFSLAGAVTLPSGTWEATSDVKDINGNVIYVLDVTLAAPTPPNTAWPILLEAPASATIDWPIETLYCDVRYTDNSGVVLATPTFTIIMEPEITDG